MQKTITTIDEYIAAFPEPVRHQLNQLRDTIRKTAPAAKEKIGYGIPTFTLEGNLVHFGCFKNHIGFYPAPQGLRKFEKELSQYKGSKGAVQFPHDKPLPLALIAKIVRFRMKMNLEKAKAKLK